MLVYESGLVKHAFVTFTIEETLSSNSQMLYERTKERLENDFGCTIDDCYSKPECLRNVLHDLYGKSYSSIMDKITSNLKEFDSDKTIFRLVKELQK